MVGACVNFAQYQSGASMDCLAHSAGVDVQMEWEPAPNRWHCQWLNMRPYFIDKTPVTQAAYAKFLRSNPEAALPNDTFNYLRNWDWGGEAARNTSTSTRNFAGRCR